MIGGLYFGPAGWHAERLEALTCARALVRVPEGRTFEAGRKVARGEPLIKGEGEEVDVLAPLDGVLAGREKLADSLRGPGSAEALAIKAVEAAKKGNGKADADGAAASEPALGAVELPGLEDGLRRAGIGQTSAGLPSLLSQLRDLREAKARAIVVNMMPMQPESVLPRTLSVLEMPRLQAGLQWLRRSVTARRTTVALDRHDLRCRRAWRKALRRQGVRTVRLLNQYPQGNPTVLLWSLLGLKLPVGELPTRAGVVVVDAVTLWAMGGFVLEGLGLVSRPVEVFCTDQQARVVVAPLGMALEDLLKQCDAEAKGMNRQTIVNGMLAGMEVDAGRSVVEMETASVSVRARPMAEESSGCIQCGWCVDHCPTGLTPVRLHDLARSERGAASDEAGEALHCISCGLCSYVCPTRLPLMAEVVRLGGLVRAQRGIPGTAPADAAGGRP